MPKASMDAPSTLPILLLRASRQELAPRPQAEVHAEPWAHVAPVPLVELLHGAVPRQGTALRVAWAQDRLAVLFHAEDAEPWATLRERDAPLYQEEVCEVFLDPVADLRSYFEIEVNPLNTVMDLVIRRTRRGLVKNFAWQCAGLATAVKVGPDFWTAELHLPFSSLALAPPQPGDQWRANFTRIDRPRSGPRELSAWAWTGSPTFHVAERFGRLEFVE